MADNDTTLDATGATVTYATDDISSVKVPRVKVALGVDGTHRRDWSGEMTPHRAISAASNNATSVKASAGHLGHISVTNLNAAPVYLKLYNKATAPAPASDNSLLVYVVSVPPSSLTPVIIDFANPLYFSTGIGYALVTGIADTNNTSVAASESLINIGYQ
jgi:hypothetical protein